MMSKKQVEELLESLKNIEDKLETIIRLQKTVLPKPSLGKEQKKVLRLCDRKHTIDDIVKETGKTENNVKVILSHLRDKGLIRSVEIKNKLVYEKM
jgi:hypothetical protein